ncbi:MAG: hypothetical protein DRQ48_06630, partial [Gammaproteobacteria bacterium]
IVYNPPVGNTFAFTVTASTTPSGAIPFALVVTGDTEPPCTAPDPITDLSAGVGGLNRIDLSWTGVHTPVASATWNVYRSLSAGGSYTQIASGLTSTTYSDTGVSGGTTYYYKVTGLGADSCESLFSNVASATATGDCTLPPTFAGITSAADGSVDNPCTINLEWNPATAVCTGPITYRVFRETSSGFTPGVGNQIAGGVSCSGSPCTYSDIDTLISGTPYYYVVRAYDASSAAEDSNTVEATATPSGSVPVGSLAYEDDFDGNRPASAADYWIEATFSGDDNSGNELALNTSRSRSTTTSYKFGGAGTGDYTSGEDNGLSLGGDGSGVANGLVIPADATNIRLRFWHTYEFEPGGSGAFLYYSDTVWSSVTYIDDVVSATAPYIMSGGYTGDIGIRAWDNVTIPNFSEVVVNCDAMAGETLWFLWRFYTNGNPNREGYYLDDVTLTYDIPGGCTTGGSCTDPGAPAITSITDNDACAQDGVTINFNGGSGAASHDLYDDGGLVVTGFTSGSSYDPGDTASHSYVVRAIDASCFTDSSPSNFADAGLGTPSIDSITDDDVCLQTGIHVNYTGGSDATSHDLLRNGTPVVTGYVSGALYNPGSSTSYTYTIRANKGACTEISGGSAFVDAADAPGTPSIAGITDDDACAQSGIHVAYTAGSGATSHNLVRGGSVVVSGYVSGALYNPGDSNSYSYVIRAVNGTCTTDSGSSNFTDTNDGLAAPGAPSVTDDDACAQSGMTISWGAVSGATSYTVRVDGTTTIYTGAGTSIGYDPGNTSSHTYDVQASNASCTGSWSGVTTATDEAGAPGTPGAPGVADVASCALTGVQITWGAVSGATGYDLWVDGTTLVTGVPSGSTYSPLDSNSHNYQVRAVNVCGSGAWSGATAGIDGDHSFTWKGIDTAADRDSCDDTGVALRWSTPASWNDGGGSGTRSFTVYRDAGILTSGLAETLMTIDDTTGTNGTSYDYSVEAVNAYGCTVGSATTQAATDVVGGPPTFTGLQTVTAMPNDICGLRLDWNAATSNCSGGPTVYNVYRSTTSGFTPNVGSMLASCVADLEYEDTSGVVGGTTYYYVVRAEDSSLGHGGPCGDGFEETNTDQFSGSVSAGASTITVYDDGAFDGSATPADYWNTGHTFGNPYAVGHACNPDPGGQTFYDDWHLPETGACTGNTVASNDGAGDYRDPNNGALILGDPPVGGGPPFTDGGIVLPAGATSITLTFNHDYDFEGSDWDGGRVMISADDWPTFTAITPAGGYPGTIYDTTSYCHPWPNTEAYIGDSGGCVGATFDLTAYAGQRIWLAWNHGADDWNTSDEGWFIDDVLIEAEVSGSACSTAPDPVQSFTARSVSSAVKLEWQNPASGAYSTTRVCVDTGAFPTNPATCTLAAPDQSTGLNNYDTMTVAGSNGTTYYFAAFVDSGSGEYSPAQTVTARPFATTGPTQWAYHTSATALAPPGLYPGAAGTGASYGVSNDRVLHGMNSTTGGGDWPRTAPFDWMPMGMNGPAQDRPPIVPTTAVTSGGGGDLVAFLGSQDGHVYAVNAKTGQTLWQSTTNYGLVQGAPAGMFTAFGGAYDLLFAGSRVAGSGNSMYGINLADGSPAWSFGGTIGIISSGATVDYANNRLYFASRENPSGSNHTLWCISFDGTSASLVWSKAYGDIDSAPVLFDGVLYVGTNAGIVGAVNPVNGDIIWTYSTNDGPVKGYIDYEFVTGGPRKVFFATTNDVWALTDNGASVSLAWRQTDNAVDVVGPSIPLTLADQGAMYVGSTDGRLYQLNTASGAVVTSAVMGAGTATVGSPGYDWMNSLAYVGAEDGSVYAVTLP